MKNLFLLIACVLMLASCKSTRVPIIPDGEKYTAFEISKEQAEEYERNYQQDPTIKKNFREGMYLPVSVIDELRKITDFQGLAIYYGKHPDYSSPVFILYASKVSETTKQAKSTEGGGGKIFLVYYPCPTICGK